MGYLLKHPRSLASGCSRPARRPIPSAATDCEVMEALQILKYFYKQERLNFASQLLAREDDYTIEGPITEAAMDELLRTGQYDVLDDLIRNSKEQAGEMA